MILKEKGAAKKTEGRPAPKSGGISLAVGTYLQRGSAPPPPPGCIKGGAGVGISKTRDWRQGSHGE